MVRIFWMAIMATILQCTVMDGEAVDSHEKCSQERQRMVRLEKPEIGWDVTFVDRSKVIRRDPYKQNNQDLEFTSIQYGFKKQVVAVPEVIVDRCDRTAALGTLYFLPERVSGIEKNGRVFAYIVSAQMVSGSDPKAYVIGAKMNVVYYDMHGTGKFDAVQTMAPVGLPFVPDWVK